MARKVFVSSDISHDERLLEVAEADPNAALLWPWILTVFDDWGRAEAHPLRLKAQVFPLNSLVDRKMIENALDRFAAAGLIERYTVDGADYMAIDHEKWVRWQTHIRWDRKAKGSASQFPDPPATVQADPDTVPAPSGSDPDTIRATPVNSTPSPSPSPSTSSYEDAPLVLDEERSDPEGGIEVWVDENGKVRKRIDRLWEVACRIWGNPASDTERGKRNRELSQLREAGVTPGELPVLFTKAAQRGYRPGAAGILRNLGDLREGVDLTKNQVRQLEREMSRRSQDQQIAEAMGEK